MREPKPYWGSVPRELRHRIQEMVGSTIRTATRVFGGYGPSATFRLFLDDGRTIFAKGAGEGSLPENWRVVPLEEAAYRDVSAIHSIAPRYFGSVSADGWHLLLLEDLKNAKKVPPWSETYAIQAVRDIAVFHLGGLTEAGRVEPMNGEGMNDNWFKIKHNENERAYFVELFRDKRREAEDWLDRVVDTFIEIEAELMRDDQPWGLIHRDIRSDNFRFRDGRLVLFDWAAIRRGPLMFDIGFFFPSIEGEGGPMAERLLPEYKSVMTAAGIEFPSFAEQSVAVAVAGFFSSQAGKPAIPVLPRLRYVQRLQLGPALRWASNQLGLPHPPMVKFNME